MTFRSPVIWRGFPGSRRRREWEAERGEERLHIPDPRGHLARALGVEPITNGELMVRVRGPVEQRMALRRELVLIAEGEIDP